MCRQYIKTSIYVYKFTFQNKITLFINITNSGGSTRGLTTNWAWPRGPGDLQLWRQELKQVETKQLFLWLCFLATTAVNLACFMSCPQTPLKILLKTNTRYNNFTQMNEWMIEINKHSTASCNQQTKKTYTKGMHSPKKWPQSTQNKY